MARVDPSGIDDNIGAHCRHWAISHENSSFILVAIYHVAGSRQSWEHFRRAVTGGELDKATEIPWKK